MNFSPSSHYCQASGDCYYDKPCYGSVTMPDFRRRKDRRKAAQTKDPRGRKISSHGVDVDGTHGMDEQVGQWIMIS